MEAIKILHHVSSLLVKIFAREWCILSRTKKIGRFWSRAKQPVKARAAQNNFTDWNRDKTFGFLLGYNYFHQFRNINSRTLKNTSFTPNRTSDVFAATLCSFAANCVIDSSTRAARQNSTLPKLWHSANVASEKPYYIFLSSKPFQR